MIRYTSRNKVLFAFFFLINIFLKYLGFKSLEHILSLLISFLLFTWLIYEKSHCKVRFRFIYVCILLYFVKTLLLLLPLTFWGSTLNFILVYLKFTDFGMRQNVSKILSKSNNFQRYSFHFQHFKWENKRDQLNFWWEYSWK